ncbi:MAG: hypothetical protein Pg6B_08890 [Candidatus Azobacteroides pseudotrichonymphae]|nr:MAG: hypothetical protein Pg6B_08890 [Candidatus Azobacteroides pseudotrichonymphae]
MELNTSSLRGFLIGIFKLTALAILWMSLFYMFYSMVYGIAGLIDSSYHYGVIAPQPSMDEHSSVAACIVPSPEDIQAASVSPPHIPTPEEVSRTFGPAMQAHREKMVSMSIAPLIASAEAQNEESMYSSSFNKEQQGPDYDSLNRLRLAYASKKDYMGDNTVLLPDGSEFHRAGGEKNNWTTQLLPNEDRAYRDWIRANHMQKYEWQYDLAAFWKNGVNSAAGFSAADFEKVKSTFEKPSSPTFTDESFYHNELNLSKGHWLTTKSGKSHFVTSETAEYLGTHGQHDTDIDDKAIDRILSLNKEELLLNRYMDEDPSGVKAAHFLHDIKKISPTNFSALMEMRHIKQYHLQEQEVWKKRFPDGFDKDGVWETNMVTGSSVQWDSEKLRKGENPIIEPFRNATNLGYDGVGNESNIEYIKRLNPLHESWGQKIGNLFSSIMGGAKPDTPFSHSFTVHAPGEKNWFGIATSAFIKPMGDLGVWCARFLSNLADADPTLHGVAQYLNQAADKAEIDIDTELGNDMALAKHGDNWYNPYRLTNSTFGLLGTGVKIMIIAGVGQQLAGAIGMAFGAGWWWRRRYVMDGCWRSCRGRRRRPWPYGDS